MNKEILHIFYDGEIKAVILSNAGQSFLTSSWQDILVSLNKEQIISRTCKDDRLIVEYEGIVVKIDDWKKTIKNNIINRYLMTAVAKQLNTRAKEVKKFNESVIENKQRDSQVIIDTDQNISRILKEKHDRAFLMEQQAQADKRVPSNKPLHVARKNKYKYFIVPIVAGGLTLFSIAYANTFLSPNVTVSPDSTITENSDIKVENSEIEESFRVGLDINEIAQPLEQSNTKFDYTDRSQDDKLIETRIKYGSIIEECAKKCGLDPNIVLGIATQESGDHEMGLNMGSNGGLMQIEVSYWEGKDITYYDFDDKQYYKIEINNDTIEDVNNNILVGCAILQQELKSLNYNIPLAIQSYNMGYNNINKVLDATSKSCGLTKMQIINDSKCLEWLNFTFVPGLGDPNYANNVLSYTGYGYNKYEISCKKPNGDLVIQTTTPMINDNPKVI